jgi:TRAP-type C4-dicarboxylate transport system substrate-binding protein
MQISFGSLNYLAGKFQLSIFTALPFLMNSAEEESVVFWRLYKSGALDSEFDELMPLYIQAFPQAALHFSKPQPEAVKSLAGLKIIASGQIPTQLMTRFGASPLSIPLTDSYTALERGVGDGLYFPWSGFIDFKFNEVTKFHIEAPLGGGPGGVWMMKKKYQSLPAEVRQVIDANSGEAQSRKTGAIMDELNKKSEDSVKAGGQTVVQLAPSEESKWKTMAEPILTDWASISPAHAKVLALVKAEVAKFRSGN